MTKNKTTTIYENLPRTAMVGTRGVKLRDQSDPCKLLPTMAFYRKRLLPPLLPILAVEDQVLLPGTSMVLQVNDLQGYGCITSGGMYWTDVVEVLLFTPNVGVASSVLHIQLG